MVDETKIKTVMASVLRLPAEEIGANASMDTIEMWDSLKHMNLVLALEEEFNVSIPDEDAANITSYALIKVVLEDLSKT